MSFEPRSPPELSTSVFGGETFGFLRGSLCPLAFTPEHGTEREVQCITEAAKCGDICFVERPGAEIQRTSRTVEERTLSTVRNFLWRSVEADGIEDQQMSITSLPLFLSRPDMFLRLKCQDIGRTRNYFECFDRTHAMEADFTRSQRKAGVFGHGLGSFGNCVLCEFTGKQKSDGRLNFPTGDGAPLVVVSQTGRFGGDALENIVDEGIHDGHGFAGNSSVGVDLFQDFVDVNGERFLPALLPLFLSPAERLLGLSAF
ncbi:histone H2B [Trichonephila inaurata madagascariensis]|uniref:Histone H2B n=1 Tax=Trichonephila inaurata madagascariensis TaxID=2747483 RepID=A0A8X7C790_9ARAC|nr:histone H2B [Trichonephila inaurata madagascariensis]